MSRRQREEGAKHREGKVAAHLHRAEEAFRTLVENLPDVIARFGLDARYLYASPLIESVTGRPGRDLVGKTIQESALPPALAAAWDGALQRVLASGQPERVDVDLLASDGARYFDCRFVPERDPDGIIRSVLGVTRDVTDKARVLEAERHARAIADALREATAALTRSLDRESVLVTLLDWLRQLVPVDRASVMLVEEASRLSVRAIFDGARTHQMPPATRPQLEATEHPLVRNILETGVAKLIPDTRVDPDWSLGSLGPIDVSWMGVPLFALGGVAGLVALAKNEADYFRAEHVKLAEAVSTQASVAVENAILYEQMQASTARLRSLSRRLVAAQESERRHIALELHDEAGDALVSLRLGLRLLEREMAEGGSAVGRVAELVRATDGVIDGLHRLAADLRPASLDHLGLDAALRQYTGSAPSKLGVPVHFMSRGFAAERLDPEVETSLYRIVQEALTNVGRHAHASRVDVMVERRDGHVVVVVEDDGDGFDPAQLPTDGHFGLLGMRERTEALGGTLTIESAPGKGTTIVAKVPSADSHPDR